VGLGIGARVAGGGGGAGVRGWWVCLRVVFLEVVALGVVGGVLRHGGHHSFLHGGAA